MNEQTFQYTIYIGLNDADTGMQKHDTGKYVSLLRKVCQSYHVAFSFHLTNGGYFHDDGRYTEENTLVLMLMNTPEETVVEIAKDLCAFFHQESVMMTKDSCSVVFIRENFSFTTSILRRGSDEATV